MDASHFDAFVRSIPFAGTRRTALGRLFGSGLASLFLAPAVEAGDAEAKKNKRKRRRKKQRKTRRKKTCKNGTKKCGKTCIAATECCGGCGEEACCEGDCADLTSNLGNCGACGNACVGDACFNGACACQGSDQCPNGCLCLARRDGGFGCAGSFVGSGDCTTDADCPALGSFCSSFSCTDPCRP